MVDWGGVPSEKEMSSGRGIQNTGNIIQITEDRRQKFLGHKMIQCFADKNVAALLCGAQQLAVMFVEEQRRPWEFMKGY